MKYRINFHFHATDDLGLEFVRRLQRLTHGEDVIIGIQRARGEQMVTLLSNHPTHTVAALLGDGFRPLRTEIRDIARSDPIDIQRDRT